MDLEELVINDDSGVRISAELGTQLFLQLEGVEVRLKSVLVGLDPGNYLILQLPHMSGIKTKLYPGNQVIVRYVKSGTIYGFQCNVVDYIMKPFRLLFLSYPKIVSSHNLRKQQRVDCFIPVSIFIEGKEYCGAVMDISGGGCLLTCQASTEGILPKIEVGDKVKFSFQLPGQTGVQVVTGQVRSIRQDCDKKSIGLQFDHSNPEAMNQIGTYVENVSQFKDLA